MLLLTFAAFYFAVGPGNYFAVDEAMEEETAQALILRRTLDIPPMTDTRPGRGQSYYTVKGPGVPFAALPFVYLGLKLDDAFGSMNGGPLAGPPLGAGEQSLRWGGRLAISASLIFNALVGGAIVAMLLMVGMRLTSNARASMMMAVAAGLATPVMTDATHFFQHPMAALMLIVAFWFFADKNADDLDRRGLYGGLSLGLAVLARPDAAAEAVVLWAYGAVAAWKADASAAERIVRMIRRAMFASIGPAASVAGYLYYNNLKFGSATQFGYNRNYEQFGIDPAQIAKVIIAYLISPSLSIFLYAPPLIVALAAGRWAFRRWPLETSALALAAAAHLLLLSCYGSWSGDVYYGPRHMLAPIVMLMPLTLPAFEVVADFRSRWATMTIAALVGFGMVIQLIGVTVFVAVTEWHRTSAGNVAGGAFAFVPSASPIVIDLKELVAGRNLGPWAIRAWAHPGPALALWVGLIVVTLAGARWLIGYFRAPTEHSDVISSGRLPAAIVVAVTLPILAGFAIVRPLNDPPWLHVYNMLEAGLTAQKAGYAIAAEEDYVVVLGLDPSNKFARYNLGILEQDAGHTDAALSLYEQAVRDDPNFTPAWRRIVSLQQARAAK